MIAAPAVDLRGGRCVQLVGGRPEDERISLPDPVAAAKRWYDSGFETLHVVDLDAALGSGDNLDLILEIVAATPATTQVGGGIRDDERAKRLLDGGADRIVVGTRALDDRAWLDALARTYPERVMVALDTREGRILRRGWTEESPLELATYLPGLGALPLAGILSTDVGREGRLQGIDRDAAAAVVAASPHPVWASGGVTTTDELAYLDSVGAAGAVLGMALYTETLDPAQVAARWGGAAGPHT
ncbi:MAG TPA: 1-(5-phosphoribosyl)-5-[(5-phosphoribosylamino)methylideneamino] imidazole-4-carboxamide isomerase [Gaiellaceae bacterium]|nr:1-(5-phosphoribosyl)-5-[(5-phosphoribosylamino)methylideneamino] imidazole-4-carboxamide isomerase [Gaiellaceae bacterium]